MKKLLFLVGLLASFSMASAPSSSSWYNGTFPKRPPKVVEVPFSYLAADVYVVPGDTTYSQVFDLWKVPLPSYDSLGQVTRIDTTMGGSVVVSGYDVSDSSGLTDSVIVTTTVQEARFAADGTDPSNAFSAAWDSVSAVTLAAASDANALVNGSVRPPLKTREHRYIRFRIINLSAASGAPLKNKCRVRVFYQMKKREM